MEPELLFRKFDSLQSLDAFPRTYRFHYLPTVDSTNTYAKKFQGETPAIFLSPDQTGGRGRFERKWVSAPYSALCFSLLYRHPSFPNHGLIPIIAAVAVAEAIETLYGIKPDIKWPNDIYLDGGKVAGILVESVVREGRVQEVIIGIGLNLFRPAKGELFAELETKPSFLEEFTAIQPEPLPLFQEIVFALDKHLFSGENDKIIRRWMSFCRMIGKVSQFAYKGERLSGTIIGLNASGELLVETNSGIKSLISGDVTFQTE